MAVVLLPMLLFAALLMAASASAACPNEVFRTGPSAKLPECRAYELVSPRYTGGITPTMTISAVAELSNAGEIETISPDGNDIVFNTDAGTFSGFPGTGDVDRYRSRRTVDGWKVELVGPRGDQVSLGSRPGAMSPDHDYFFQTATSPQASIWAPWVGLGRVDMLRTPNGFEPLARGSLGDDPGDLRIFSEYSYGTGKMITENGTHVFFISAAHLEPLAAPAGTVSIYDRTPGGPTKVISLLPGDQPATKGAWWLGATADGSEVAFELGNVSASGHRPIYVRKDDVTYEALRPSGVVVGKALQCTGGPGSATLQYRWLREGAPIGGATSSTYTVAAEDEGAVLQCQVTASTTEGTSVSTSVTWLVEPYRETNTPELQEEEHVEISPSGAQLVGTQLTCQGSDFHVSGATYTYAWLREGVLIAGATASTYAPVEADVGKSIQCRKTATTAGGAAVAYSAPLVVIPVFPKASASPAIANATDPGDAPEAGDELTCSSGTWSGSPSLSYQWLRNGAAIGGATANTYTVTVADEGTVSQCVVSAEASAGTTQATAPGVTVDPQPGTAPPEMTSPYGVSGTSSVGSSLFCGAGAWSGEPSFSRQWLRNGAPIVGATEASYTLTEGDKEKVIQCRLTATNAGGSTVAIDGGAGAQYVTAAAPIAAARMPSGSLEYAGIFNGHLFYADRFSKAEYITVPADLYSYDLDTGRSTAITDTGDASFVNVSEDGSRVYFARTFESGGEKSGKLYLWSRGDDSTTLIADLSGADVTGFRPGEAGLTTWTRATGPRKEWDSGRANNHTRSTVDGSVLVFEATTQLTDFDNTEATPETCANQGFELCDEVYRYSVASDQLTCISCGPGEGPATGEAELFMFGTGVFGPEFQVATALTPIANLSKDGGTVVFESTEALVPRDVNDTRDVYRWKVGKGVSLVSTGQSAANSALFGVSPTGNDIVFGTREQLLPEDENGAAIRLYDARVDGGFPPPESTVTEPCAGDVCQGAPSAAPEPPRVASSSLDGTGNVKSKLRCGKGKRRVVRHGKERCVKRRHHRGHQHRRAGANRRTGR